MSFKLLAIRPLESCNKKFLKNLEANRIYKFYNDYEFQDSKENEIIDFSQLIDVSDIKIESTIPTNLYGDNINISAIVGKNGSGKSALVELFIAIINNLSFLYGFNVNHNGYEDVDFLRYNPQLFLEFYFENKGLIYKIKIDKSKLKHSFYSLIDNKFEILPINDHENYKLFINENFFYTNVINYSLWSYNHREIGNFITALFHKNDAYQVPIVLNPFRGQGGIIDPESEKELAMDRLLFNVFQQNENATKITDTLELIKISLELRKGNYDKYSMFRENKNGIVRIIEFKEFKDNIENQHQKEKLLKYLFEFYGLNYEKYFYQPEWESTIEYLLYKTVKIVTRYEEFQRFINIDSKTFKENKFDDFLIEFSRDSTHITLKIRQIFNFIKYHSYLELSLDTKEINIQRYSEKIFELKEKYDTSLLDMLPPSIFKIKLHLTNDIEFSQLSSGEKQMISTINSILYHLNNLYSVKQKEGKIKYYNFNLILEEIELYFHPEYQKSFIKRILNGIKTLNFSGVNINILFITHSPFILSDIPKQNVLFLEANLPNNKSITKNFNEMNTFGANITDLLADSFFIEDGLIGNFAKDRIEEIISWLNSILNIKDKIVLLEDNKYKKAKKKKKRLKISLKRKLMRNIKILKNIIN
ncbi:hypothetical protein [Chryseobacterium sp. ERMR1:04]|uniref:hypothetical protein n=1 Tax=Chryseobacterium sp. ERMR1:04 TaxID=1705393 RepID=UPI0006C8AA86|nr:hypothetical protein [Chryseobacterium sp. ERMR1:04]KPH14463.1 hypothetical protein AMQ68_02990 [Chryseobacterium sp. ERMR1:04]